MRSSSVSSEESNGGYPSSPFPSTGVPDIQRFVETLRKGVADRSSQLFQKLKGKVFHCVGANNKIFRYRVGFDGEITLVRRFTSLNRVTGVEDLFKDVPAKAQRRFRAAVTGDPNKRIRDHLKETPQVKMLDKISFTLGVLVICLTQWIIHQLPWSFPYFFFGLLSLLFVARLSAYMQEKCQYFLLDFCYFVNLSTMTQCLLFPHNEPWFKVNYVLSLGPILAAIVVWQNSLVFHSMDKVTSFFLHAFAPMQCHLARWSFIDPSFPPEDTSFTFYSGFVLPLLAYLLWQNSYIFLIEASPIANHLARDKQLMTSFRFLSRDRKNPINILVQSLCRKIKFDLPTVSDDGELDADAFRTKIVFFTAQFVYTVLTFSYVWILYSSYLFSCAFIISIFIWGTWNGASYYIEVFSKRYNLKFEGVKKPEEVSDEDSEDDDFAEASEILWDDLQGPSGEISILRVIDEGPEVAFLLSNEGRPYSLSELRSLNPLLLLDYLINNNLKQQPEEDKKSI